MGNFNGVALNVPGTVELRIGNTEGVTIETDDNILPLIETAVENGTLRIRPAKRNSNLRQTALTIVVHARQVERVSVGGSGTVNASGLRGEKLRFDVGGSGSINAGQLDARIVSVAIGGSGSFNASGKTEQLTASIGGSGNIGAGRLAANDVQVSIGGSGEAQCGRKTTWPSASAARARSATTATRMSAAACSARAASGAWAPPPIKKSPHRCD